ncbi:MAG: hypothetical protein ABIK62_04205 [candidate division WOR-3 bacterium]
MRIVASVCLVLALVFMVGCGTSAEDKQAIQKNTTEINKVQKDVAELQKNVTDLTKKVGDIETFLKDPKSKFGTYGVAPDTTKKAPAAVKPGEKPPEKPAEKPKETKPATKPATKQKGG